MRGEFTTFWAKLRPSDDGDACEWHPLFDHAADVGAVTEALLALPLWRRRLALLAGRDLGPTGWGRLCVLATLHDLGKLNLGFQAKGRPELGSTAGHVREALAALFRDDVFSCLAEELGSWGEGTTALMVAAICHHGRPYNADAPAPWQASWWVPRAGLDPGAGAVELLQRCRAWFPHAFAEGDSLPDVPALTHAFAGVVTLADWVGSDTRFFPFSDSDEDRMPFARQRARRAIMAMAIDVPLAERTDLDARNGCERVLPPGRRARTLQQAILSIPRDERGSITALEAETGSGKTEAALARFVELFEAGLVDGLYFALPTRSAATQIHQRVVDATRRAFASPPPVVLAVPGYLRVDDAEGRKLAPFHVLWPDHERFRFRAWAAEGPKRYLAGCIVVGTIDQVLLSSLMVRHAHLRATALLRHLLVVDEVHASDAYMERILRHVLARHVSAGGHALLLSATLGAEARTRLLHPEDDRAAAPSLEEAVATPYPLITDRSAGIHAIAVDKERAGRVVSLRPEPWLESPQAIAEEALAAAARGAKALIIRNTVRDCIATQLALERATKARGLSELLFGPAGTPAPHHSRFARVDRISLDHALESRIGEERPPGGCVVVATQTVQQSLDIDADILFSDLCPADVLLQRVGRLHRHDRERPAGFDRPQTVVAVPARRDLGALLGRAGVARNHHGLGSVYPDLRILEATWRLIERHVEWCVPQMNRVLVEHSLHSDALEAVVEEKGLMWREHAVQMEGGERGQRRQADLNLVDWSRSYAEMGFPNVTDQRIRTRLGEGDRLVRFAAPVLGPFGSPFSELVLRTAWAAGIPADLETAENVASGRGSTRFEFGSRAFLYDRLGLRVESTPAERASDDDGP